MRWHRIIAALQLGLCLLAAVACDEASSEELLSITDLAAVLRGLRLVEPRFSGGFDYAPCTPIQEKGKLIPTAQCSELPDPDSWTGKELQRLTQRLENEAALGGAPKTLHALAVLNAITSDKALFANRAIAQLEELQKRFPTNPLVLNDLAAAYFLRAVRADESSDLLKALDLVEQAYALAPQRSEISFNRALLLDRLGLVFAAKSAWKSEARDDRGEGWNQEAKEHLATLEQPSIPEHWKAALPRLARAAMEGDRRTVREIVAIDPQAAREYVLQQKLGAWGDRYIVDGSSACENELAAALEIGRALAEIGGDRTVLLAVASITESCASDRLHAPAQRHVAVGALAAERLTALALGHRALRDALRLFYSWRDGKLAHASFRLAASKLKSGDSVAALWAEEGRARALAYLARYEEALQLHRVVLSQARSRGLRSLEGWTQWGISWSLNRWLGSAFALNEAEQAYNAFSETSELENAAAANSLLGDGLGRLGQGSLALEHWTSSLQTLRRHPQSLRRHNTLLSLADFTGVSSLRNASLAVRKELVGGALASGDEVKKVEAMSYLGQGLAAVGDVEGALQELRRACDAVGRIPRDGSVRQIEADTQAAMGRILRRVSPRLAIAPLAAAIETYARDGGVRIDEARTLTERALAWASLGQLSKAREDLGHALVLLEQRKGSISSQDFRASFEEASQFAYDAAIDIEWRLGRDPSMALAALERARCEMGNDGADCRILGLLAKGNLDSVAARLPKDALVIEYAVLPERLLIWTFQGGRWRLIERPISAESLSSEVDDFIARIAAGANRETLRASSQRLFQILLPENLASPSEAVPIIVVPDRVINRVPFAALQEPGSERFLVEDHVHFVVPSLGSLLGGSAGHSRAISFEERALAVGNPAVDRNIFPGFSDLPASQEEAVGAAGLFAQATLLVGPKATKSVFLDSLRSAEVLIFAGHSVANPSHPGQAFMVLAPGASDSSRGLLFAEEISRLRLPSLKAVILSSCSSAGPRDARVSGLTGLARPFLEAGAQVVLGTLWSVNDQPQSELLRRWLQRVKMEGSIESALRSVQIEALRSGSASRSLVRSWSGLTIFRRAV